MKTKKEIQTKKDEKNINVKEIKDNQSTTNRQDRISIFTFILFSILIISSLGLVAVIARNNLTIDSIIGYYSDAADTKTITFQDENMYNAIKEKLKDKISSYEDNTKTIKMTQENIDSITELDLQSRRISDITGIENFTSLTNLYLNNNQISDISGIGKLTSLTELDLSYNQISDISGIGKLTSLTNLDLYRNQISDISVIENLTSLTYLNLGDNQISDISGIEKLTFLKSLELSHNQISDISVIENLTSLTYLYLGYNQISDISAIGKLTSLTNLDLYRNQISDISVIENLTSLTYLDLGDNQISDISALRSCSALTSLYLSNNQISDISEIGKLTSLIRLGLGGNQISDISALRSCSALTSLYLGNNQINIKIQDKTYELPTIFKESQKQDSSIKDIYTDKKLKLSNCSLSEDGQSIILKDNLAENETATVKIIGGAADRTTLTLTYTEKNEKEPVATVSYDNENWTKNDVTATISFNDENIIVTNNDGKNTYTFTENGYFDFTWKDNITGTTGTQKAIVKNIDKEKPTLGYVIVFDKEKNSINIKVLGEDKESGTKSMKLYIDDELKNAWTYEGNDTEEKTEQYSLKELKSTPEYGITIEVEDVAGNVNYLKGTYNIEKRTNTSETTNNNEQTTPNTQNEQVENANTSDSIYFIIPVLIISLLISIYINLSLNKKNKTNN